MRKTLATLLLSTAIAVTAVAPAWACTPQYDYSNIWGDLTPPSQIEYTPSEDVDKACDNAAKKWLEEHPINYTPETETETELETETESETVVETEPETSQKYMDWKKYIPESLRARWLNIVRR